MKDRHQTAGKRNAEPDQRQPYKTKDNHIKPKQPQQTKDNYSIQFSSIDLDHLRGKIHVWRQQ